MCFYPDKPYAYCNDGKNPKTPKFLATHATPLSTLSQFFVDRAIHVVKKGGISLTKK